MNHTKRNIIAHCIVLAILFSTTLIRYESLRIDMLVSPVLFLIAAFLYQRKFPSSRIYLFPLLIFLYYTIVVFIEYALSRFTSFEFYSIAFLHFISWLLGAALGQYMARSANKIVKGLLLLFFLFLLLFNKFYGVTYWFELLKTRADAHVKHVENIMVEDPEGRYYSLDSMVRNTRYTLVDCWFQQCGPCWRSLEELSQLVQSGRIANKDISVITLNLRTSNDKMRADSALLDNNTPLPVYYLTKEDTKRIGIESYPTLMLYKDGKLIAKPVSISKAFKLISK